MLSSVQFSPSVVSDPMDCNPPGSSVRVKEESEKACLKLNIQKTKIIASGPITSWQIDWEKKEKRKKEKKNKNPKETTEQVKTRIISVFL